MPILVHRPNGCRSCGYPCELPRPEHGLCTQCAEWAALNMRAIDSLPAEAKPTPRKRNRRAEQ